jgi:putative FmdB family regulatory protein
MPTYSYRCADCGHELEAFQRMSDRPLKRCPKCQGRLDRIITGGAGIIFKGKGFYVTDYARAGQDKKSPEGVSDPVKDTAKAKPADKQD